jgi:serine protease AprX
MSMKMLGRLTQAAVALAGTALLAAAPAGAAPNHAPPDSTRVVVIERGAASTAAEAAVRRSGGRVDREIPLVHGFSARVPRSALAALRRERSIRSVQLDRAFKLSSTDTAADAPGTSLAAARGAIGAGAAGDGAGVDVAVVDSGVSPVPGLDGPGKIAASVDFSADAADPAIRGLDGFGHGTHLAGIIAGADPTTGFQGIAPGAGIVNVKVADHDGSTSLSQLLAGIDWVVRNGGRDGLNVRVLNLAFGAPAQGSYRDDPLAFAVEQAWKRGFVVVTAAGNGGPDTAGLDSPAYDPFVIAAGAADTAGTADLGDDLVAPFSSAGDGVRDPDVVAPGVSLVSLRVPGSLLDQQFETARIGTAYFRGSGTSQAAAVTSAAAALLVAARPDVRPDAAKALLVAGAQPVPGAAHTLQGAGLVDLSRSLVAEAPRARQDFTSARAGGKWRGRSEVIAQLAPDLDPTAARWSAARWSAARWSAARWSAARWSAARWSAARWSAARWSAARWSAARWSASGWMMTTP